MESGRDFVVVLASIFHDVDFSRSGPFTVRFVPGEHPEGRPEVISFGKFGSDLKFSVLPSSGGSRVQSSRGVLSVVVSFWNGSNVKSPVSNVDVILSAGITLKLVVSSSDAVDFEHPVFHVQGVSVELVRPNEFVFCRDQGEGEN